jgi:hypothetical protein
MYLMRSDFMVDFYLIDKGTMTEIFSSICLLRSHKKLFQTIVDDHCMTFLITCILSLFKILLRVINDSYDNYESLIRAEFI